MIVFDHLAVLLLVGFLPWQSYLAFNKISAMVNADASLKIPLYLNAVVSMWMVTAGVMLIVWFSGRGTASLGWHSQTPEQWILGIAFSVFGAIVLYWHYRWTLLLPSRLMKFRQRHQHLLILLPQIKRHMQWFIILALTAGICEELLFRGYIFWYSKQFLPLPAAVFITNLIFAWCHIYQGSRSMGIILLLGVLLSCSCLLSASLWPAMILHSLVDLHAGFLGWRSFQNETGK